MPLNFPAGFLLGGGIWSPRFWPWNQKACLLSCCILHPVGEALPSQADLSGATDNRLGRPYAIYGVVENRVRFFIIREDRKAYKELGTVSGSDNWSSP